jgi:hypothetical protein
MLVKNRWNKRAKTQSLADIAGALGFISWKIATQGVLNLENQGYTTYSQAHRLQIIGEFLAFLLQVADRIAYTQLTVEARQQFITTLALRMVDTYVDNQQEISSSDADHRAAFITLLNQRATDYAAFSFDVETGTGFDFLRYFGVCVAAVMVEKQWVGQQIAEIEGPEAVKTFQNSMKNLSHSA